MSHASVCHRWASRKHESGRSGNISFRGDTIYSYHWWPMGKWHTAPDGTQYVIMPDVPYSSSTGRQMDHVYTALPRNTPVYRSRMYTQSYYSGSRRPVLEPEAVLPQFLEEIKKVYDNAFNMRMYSSERANTPVHWQFMSEAVHKRASEFCKMTGVPWLEDIDIYVISDYEREMLERMVEPIKAKVLERIAKREEKERLVAEAYEDVLAKYGLSPIEAAKAWMRGDVQSSRTSAYIQVPHDHPYYKLIGVEKIRQTMATAMRIEGAYVVTNLSASVPVESAKRLWNIMKANQSVNGEAVGDYRVIKWNGELVIGCHHIPREIVEYFVELNNW